MEIGESLNDLHRGHADADDLAHQPYYIAGIIFTVRVGIALHLILVDDPFQRRPLRRQEPCGYPTGEVDSQSKRARAETVASAVLNVQQVVNELHVKR
jgi:hypothetical protein